MSAKERKKMGKNKFAMSTYEVYTVHIHTTTELRKLLHTFIIKRFIMISA